MKTLARLILCGAILFPTLSIVISCSEDADCSMAARGMMNCNIYTLEGEEQIVSNDTLDLITITASGTDSVIINREEEAHSLSLPLRYSKDSTVLVFHYDKASTDTVVVHHTNTPYFLSMECGYQMKQAITGVRHSRHVLDSIYIANKEAGIYGTENLKLFY